MASKGDWKKEENGNVREPLLINIKYYAEIFLIYIYQWKVDMFGHLSDLNWDYLKRLGLFKYDINIGIKIVPKISHWIIISQLAII